MAFTFYHKVLSTQYKSYINNQYTDEYEIKQISLGYKNLNGDLGDDFVFGPFPYLDNLAIYGNPNLIGKI